MQDKPVYRDFSTDCKFVWLSIISSNIRDEVWDKVQNGSNNNGKKEIKHKTRMTLNFAVK